MRVLMLGWEFPPFITGGLGTACHGLTKALDRRGVEVTFVLPKHVDGDAAGHITLISPATEWCPGQSVAQISEARPAEAQPSDSPSGGGGERGTHESESAFPGTAAHPTSSDWGPEAEALVASGLLGLRGGARGGDRVDLDDDESAADTPDDGAASTAAIRDPGRGLRRLRILGRSSSGPYGAVSDRSTREIVELLARHGAMAPSPAGGFLDSARLLLERVRGEPMPVGVSGHGPLRQAMAAEQAIQAAIPEAGGRVEQVLVPRTSDYGGDLIGDAHRYARFVVAACAGRPFDVIHAHDWLTYPAGLALASVTGRPLVVHVHSTEFDRSGLHVNQRIYDIERRGMHGALAVISVSMLTKNLCINRYGVPGDKIEVVYNGVDLAPEQVGMEDIAAKDKIVLYFGRITMQKGPEYFVQAAKRVLEVHKDVKFVVAGSGDQAQRMIELAASLGIGHKMLFTGFLRGKDIARVFALADLYVMPSVSEPFGIAPLEAMGHNVPVLISRTSGVSEVLTNALKCDFWDVDDMANKIVAVLRYPPLQRTLIEHGSFEVRKLTWDGAAARCAEIYERMARTMPRPAAGRR